MKHLLIICLLLSGCTFQMKPAPEVVTILNQHGAVLNAIAVYIKDLQDRGVLPVPTPAPQVKK